MGEIVSGKVIKADPSGLTVHIPYSNWERYATRGYVDVLVELEDSRLRSLEQVRKVFALIGEICEYECGYRSKDTLADVYAERKADFINNYRQSLVKSAMSLQDSDMTSVSEFITYLVDTIIEMGIPTKIPTQELCEDIERWIYGCAKHMRCCACGKGDELSELKAEVHHLDRVGMGGDRKHMDHEGMRFLPLCRSCHGEAHRIGDLAFMEKWHLEPVTITKDIIKKYKLGTAGKGLDYEQIAPHRKSYIRSEFPHGKHIFRCRKRLLLYCSSK